MKYAHIVSAFFSLPWAILHEKYEQIRAFLRLKAEGGDVAEADVREILAARRNDDVQMVGRVALLPVMGTICQRCGLMSRASGGVSTEDIGNSLDSLVADKQVRCIVMCFDSPGGSVFGVPELATRIRAARDQKKIVGFADPMAASAAYWLMSQCSELWCTPSGQVGSIGVVCAHDDISEQLKMDGVKTTYVTSSQYKAEGAPEEPLSPEAKAEMQAKVNAYHAMFVSDIAKGRGITETRVEKDFGQGRMMTSAQAKSAGMIDRIGTMQDVLRKYGDTSDERAETLAPTVPLAQAAARARAVQVLEEN